MAFIPTTHERTWYTIANIPAAASGTAADISRSLFFNLKLMLCNQHTGGVESTSTGTRNANSIWSVVSSSDGVNYTGSVDRWGTTFNASKLVTGSYNASHSWIVLKNDYIGYQLLIDLSSTTAGSGRLVITKTTDPFITTSLTSAATPSTEGFPIGTTNPAANITLAYFTETTAGGTRSGLHYSHLVLADNGEFCYLTTMANNRRFDSLIAFLSTEKTSDLDTRNFLSFFNNAVGSDGGLGVANVNITAGGVTVSKRGVRGNIPSVIGIVQSNYFSANPTTTYQTNFLESDSYYVTGIQFMSGPETYYDGRIKDFYLVYGTPPPTALINCLGTKKYILAGSIIVPFIDVNPIT